MSNQSENINELVLALSKAQGEGMKAKQDSKNPFFKSNYADLESVWDCCREVLSKNGLAVIQSLNSDNNGRMLLETTLAHSSGQWIKSCATVPHTKPDAQSIGSAVTYMRRYTMSAILGIASTDDDGTLAKINQKAVDEVIDEETLKNMDEFLNGHTQIRKDLLKLCSVSSLNEIKKSQLNACKNFINIQREKLKEANKEASVLEDVKQ